MKKILPLITLIFCLICVNSALALQTIEEINADLISKKAEIEAQKNAKKTAAKKNNAALDLESLGLDDVEENKTAASKEVKDQSVENVVEKSEEKPLENKEVKSDDKANEKKMGNNLKEKIIAPVAKVKELIKEKVQQIKPENSEIVQQDLEDKTLEKSSKNKHSSKVNAKKNAQLKKRLNAERQKIQNEKKRKEQLKKLSELRKIYLNNSNSNSNSEKQNLEEEIILPQRKEHNPFLVEETPPQPIIERYRTKDNFHIPFILSSSEKVAILFSAISSGDVAFFNSAYNDVGDVDVKNTYGDTLLTYAILLQKYKIVSSILTKGANPNLPNDLGYTPINIALEMLDLKSLELLLANRADIFYRDAFDRTYLMHAARLGFLQAAELFVLNGVDVNAMDKDGFTALSIAYRNKREVLVKYLLKNGAKPWVEKPFEPGQTLIKELENRWK